MGGMLGISGGIIFGIVSSISAWLLTMHAIKPKLIISPEISRITPPEDYESKYLYRIKVYNQRRWRAALNVSVRCELSVQGIFPDRRNNRATYNLSVNSEHLFRIKPRQGRIFWIKVDTESLLFQRLPLDLQQKCIDGDLRLEELLAIPAKLRFFVSCHDSFSNAPFFEEREYTAGTVAIATYEIDSAKINRSNRTVELEIHEILDGRRSKTQVKQL